ncbi:hypothetical protein F442_07623 [Phytophthora nicotianae P10297]|uniref:Uncharacterized protein n=1 Tax=Phytophthora nicotianae P10297 TaxID=1317064 RepID=W2ZGH3_PHYNI|nr:hypothetical protein F442_07623 [Phytophthora nicotianae P10297]
MVRRATLQVNGFVFLLPEHVEGLAEYPFYAKVSALTAEKVTVRSLDLDDPVTCEIDIDIARTLTVTKVEATRTRVASHVFNWKIESSSLNQRD